MAESTDGERQELGQQDETPFMVNTAYTSILIYCLGIIDVV